MDEFKIIHKYFKKLSSNNSGAYGLTDDIFYDSKKKFAISVDTYVHKIHFLSLNPKNFVKKILRSSLSDLYCKGIKPKLYFLSLVIDKRTISNGWLNNFKSVLSNEQKKFDITLCGGDIVYGSNLVITFTVLGYSKKKPVLRSGSSLGDDIYVTGNIGDSYLGLNIIKKKFNFPKHNNFFKNCYYKPNLPVKIYPFLKKIASSSIDVSDGLFQDLKHLCSKSKSGAFINLNYLPLSLPLKDLVNNNKIKVINFFSKGDDYQVLFTSNKKNRKKIRFISKKIKTKITRIGQINNKKDIIISYNNKIFKTDPKKMGYTHSF